MRTLTSPHPTGGHTANSSAHTHQPPTRPRARRSTSGDLPSDRLEGELIDLAGRLAAGTYELLVLVGEFDKRGARALRGALSCAAWRADLCDIDLATARTQVRVAKGLGPG